MTAHKANTDEVLDKILEDISRDTPDSARVKQAAARVWKSLSGIQAEPPRVSRMESTGQECGRFRSWISPYLAKQLSEPEAMLLQDHLQECLGCRRLFNLQRSGKPLSATQAKEPTFPRAGWLLAAAALILAVLGIGRMGLLEQIVPDPEGDVARVESMDGMLFQVSSAGSAHLQPMGGVAEGVSVRTAKDSAATLRLRDGSKIELSERAELTIDETWSGRTIQLKRGNIIVQAAQQKDGYLRVATEDCLVKVKGTTFAVNHGLKGSRVSVIEGIVTVERRGREESLNAGQQLSTRKALARVPVEKEIAWSRNAGQHLELLREFSSLGQEIEDSLMSGITTSTALLDLAPAQVVVYGSVPNLTENLTDLYDRFQSRLEESDALSEWWATAGENDQVVLEELLRKVELFGSLLGDEMVFWLSRGDQGQPAHPLILAQSLDDEGLLQRLRDEAAQVNQEAGKTVLHVLTDPAEALQFGEDQPYLIVWDGLFLASPSPQALQAVSDQRSHPESQSSDFLDRVRSRYADGVGYLLAVDLEPILAGGVSSQPETQDTLEAAGILDARHLLVEQKPSGELKETSAIVTFANERQGLASWLAAPSPIGALDFVSADAKMVAAFAVKDPVLMVEDLFQLVQGADPEGWERLNSFQLEKGLDIQEDVARPLGGEMVFAVDGPLFPSVGWKVVLEVYDSAGLQQTIDWAVEELNRQLESDGHLPVELQASHAGGRVYYSLVSAGEMPEFHYVFVDGYMVGAPERSLVQDAISYRETGFTILTSPEFLALLPSNGSLHVSALVFHDLSGAFDLVSQALDGMENIEELQELGSQVVPTLLYAYGGTDHIEFASTSVGFGGINTASLLGLGGGGVGGLLRTDRLHQAAPSQRAN